MKDNNILVGLGGQQKNVLRVMPPMCLTQDDIDTFVQVLDDTIASFSITENSENFIAIL